MIRSFHRRNLPHLYYDFGIYFIAYRLKNSIPVEMLRKILSPNRNWNFEKFCHAFMKYDSWLDSNRTGENYLVRRNIAEECKLTLHYPDGKEYLLICYSIMPNHIHVVFKLLDNNKGISKIMQSIRESRPGRAIYYSAGKVNSGSMKVMMA